LVESLFADSQVHSSGDLKQTLQYRGLSIIIVSVPHLAQYVSKISEKGWAQP
jgi:hypothetical protein